MYKIRIKTTFSKECFVMIKELNINELDSVVGGQYVINGNTRQVAFRDAKKVFSLKNCSDYQAMELMESLIGKYNTEEEYDNACIAALQSRGWI